MGFDGLMPYNGEANKWKDWRFKVTTWLSPIDSLFETLISEMDKMEKGMDEPEDAELESG